MFGSDVCNLLGFFPSLYFSLYCNFSTRSKNFFEIRKKNVFSKIGKEVSNFIITKYLLKSRYISLVLLTSYLY